MERNYEARGEARGRCGHRHSTLAGLAGCIRRDNYRARLGGKIGDRAPYRIRGGRAVPLRQTEEWEDFLAHFDQKKGERPMAEVLTWWQEETVIGGEPIVISVLREGEDPGGYPVASVAYRRERVAEWEAAAVATSDLTMVYRGLGFEVRYYGECEV